MHSKNLPNFHTTGFEHKITLVNQKWSEYNKFVYASNELFEVALSMSQNDTDAFFLISSDTIPVKPFDELYQAFSNPKTSICYAPTSAWLKINDHAYIPKTHSWFAFNKADVKQISAASKSFPAFHDIFTPYQNEAKSIHCWEEYYYPVATVKGALGGTFDPINASAWNLDFPVNKEQGKCVMYVWWADYGSESPFVAEGIPRLTERETKGAQMLVITPESLLKALRKSSGFYFMRKIRGDISANYVELSNGTHLSIFDGVRHVGLYDT
jgi:phage terminase large subunit-like protein